jgi:hypothetical protein
MLALTLYEPWASLVAAGEKRIETRSWPTDYRGPLAIHASKKLTGNDLHFAILAIEDFDVLPERSAYLSDEPKVKDAFADTRGCVIATAMLAACLPIRDAWKSHRLWCPKQGELALSEQEMTFGNYAPSRYAWLLIDVRKLAEPIPATGALGLWEWRPPAGSLTEAA